MFIFVFGKGIHWNKMPILERVTRVYNFLRKKITNLLCYNLFINYSQDFLWPRQNIFLILHSWLLPLLSYIARLDYNLYLHNLLKLLWICCYLTFFTYSKWQFLWLSLITKKSSVRSILGWFNDTPKFLHFVSFHSINTGRKCDYSYKSKIWSFDLLHF